MVLTTPFHPRLNALNTSGLFTQWAGHLSALRYGESAKHEYFAVRNSVGVFDSSPLYKYRVAGPDAERFLGGVLTRDIRRCRPGRAQYTVWCDDDGRVLDDGVVFRRATDDFLLTSGGPSHGYLRALRGRLRVEIDDVSAAYAVLAVQGPRSRTVLAELDPLVASLRPFAHAPAKIGDAPVTVSRTGFTGDLGYEVVVAADDALGVLDRVLGAGEGHGLRPFGEQALMMLRTEAGLPLRGVEFVNARTAWTPTDRLSPAELGLGWMLRDLGADRPFIGRRAIEREGRDGSSRWATVGLWIDWREWDRLHEAAGLIPPKDPEPPPWESMIYAPDGSTRIGYATSVMYSPVLQRHIALARLEPGYAAPGATVRVEVTVDHSYAQVPAQVDRLPLFDPPRRTA